MTLSLRSKLLLLVGAILLCELGFVVGLASLLHSADAEAKREEHAKLMIDKTNSLVMLCYQAGQDIKQYVVTRNRDRLLHFDELTNEVDATIKWLVANGDPDERTLLVSLQNRLNQGFAVLRKARTEIDGAGTLQLLSIIRTANSQLDPLMNKQSLPEFIALREKQEQIEMSSPATQRKLRKQAESLLYTALAANLVFALASVLAITRGVTSRLDVLVDNTRRLAASRPLQSRLSGTDEIARLDAVFHDMAKALQDAKDKERAVQELKQQIFQMVSHDLRTPLTGIKGFLELLSMDVFGELPAQAKKEAGSAERSLSRLIGMINDLLDLEKLESGEFRINSRDVAITDVIEQAGESVLSFAEQHDVIINLPATDLSVQADPDRLVQVLTNLLSNAIKYSPAGSAIDVSAEEATGQVEISVRDRGPGIPPEFQPHIFERFKQLPGDSKAGTSGLGLAIARVLIEQQGGAIGVESDGTNGSRFWVRIPKSLASTALVEQSMAAQ